LLLPVNTLAKVIATALGAGYSPIAPGTCGTLVAVPLVWALSGLSLPLFVVMTAVLTALAVWAAHIADHGWGTHDSGRIVIDEVVGYMATMTFMDRANPWALGIGFVVFRALDIIKPPPVRWLDENLPGGWGVVLDDTAAGAIGAGVMIALAHLGALTYLAGL